MTFTSSTDAHVSSASVLRPVVVGGGDAGVVVENIQTAEGLDGVLHGGADALVVTDVRRDERRFSARGTDRLDHVVAVGEVGDHHAGALRGEQLGGNTTEAC